MFDLKTRATFGPRRLKSKSHVKKKPVKRNDLYPIDQYVLDNAVFYLMQAGKNKKDTSENKERCNTSDSWNGRTDYQIKLRCRQLPNVLNELRKAILRQDWDETATLLMILCHPGLRLYSSIIIRTCFILLFCHPNSNFAVLKQFVRCLTGYVSNEEIHKYIRILFILRSTALKESAKKGKCTYCKIIDDPEFKNIE